MKANKRNVKLLTKPEALEIISLVRSGHKDQSKLLENVSFYCRSSMCKGRALEIKKALMEIGLTEFEAIQVIDCSPKTFLCLQLVVEEMEERFSEEELLEVLDLFKN